MRSGYCVQCRSSDRGKKKNCFEEKNSLCSSSPTHPHGAWWVVGDHADLVVRDHLIFSRGRSATRKTRCLVGSSKCKWSSSPTARCFLARLSKGCESRRALALPGHQVRPWVSPMQLELDDGLEMSKQERLMMENTRALSQVVPDLG